MKCYGKSKKGKSTWNKGTKGIMKANSTSFRTGHNFGINNYKWKGGYWITNTGYKIIQNLKDTQGEKILEHRFVAEKVLARKLLPEETIHHINGNRLDNNLDNLYLFVNTGEHSKFHHLKNKPILKSNLPPCIPQQLNLLLVR